MQLDRIFRTNRRYAALAVLAVVLAAGGAYLLSPLSVVAGDKAKGVVNTIGSPGVAIRGYDPVAYFKEGRPRRGKPEFAAQHKGATWRFASAENKSAFEAEPAKYEPVYGGYCAYGVAEGYLVKIEPDAWSIKDGRLYLNYDAGVQATWAKDPLGYIKKADARWPKLIAKR